MASTALVKAQQEIANLKTRASGVRERATASAKQMQRDATAVVSAYAFGAYKRDRMRAGQPMVAVLGLDTETTIVGGLYLLSHFGSGTIAEVAHDAALGIACGAAFTKAQG